MEKFNTAIFGILSFVTAAFLTTCATPQKKAEEASGKDAAISAATSQIEISYIRGQNQHRFLMRGSDEGATAKCYLDNQLLRETKIELPKYADLLKRTTEIISNVQHKGNSTELAPCRTPFTVSLKTTSAIQEVSGCRSDMEGAHLGKLIRDAEFLVFSAKDAKHNPQP